MAGSFAVAVNNNKVNASLGRYVQVNLTGDMALTALNGSEDKAATTRIIAGSLSAAAADTSVGATVAVLVDNSQVKAETLNNGKIDLGGGFIQKAVTNGEIQVFTAEMAAAASGDASNITTAAGGAVNVIVTRNITESSIGDYTGIKANQSSGAIRVGSVNKLDLLGISGSANVAAGDNSAVAAGGVANVIVDNAKAETTIGSSVTMTGFKEADISSDANDRILTGTASASVAASANGKAGAGVANVIVAASQANTALGANGQIGGGYDGDVKITANNDYLLNAGLALAGSSGLAVGGAFNVNVLNRQAVVDMKANTEVNTLGDVAVQASGRDTKILAGLSAAGGLTGSAVGGNVIALVENSKIMTLMGDNTRIITNKNAVVESHYADTLVNAAGSIALSGGSAAVGVTSVTVVKNNEVKTLLGNQTVLSGKGAAGSVMNKSGEKVQGVYVDANAKETQYIGGAGVGVGVMVLAAGAKMSQDAAGMLMYGNESEEEKAGGKKVFDPGIFMDAAGKNGASSHYDYEIQRDENGNPRTAKNEKTLAQLLAEDLEGNGHYESRQTVGTKKTDAKGQAYTGFDSASAYRDKDLDNTNYDPDNETGRGENHTFDKDSADIQKAKNLNSYDDVYNKDGKLITPDDVVLATITNTAEVATNKDVSVTASQPVAADLLGAAVGAGAVGGGVSVAVAVLHSNVLASSYGNIHGDESKQQYGPNVNGVKSVTVKAESVSGAFTPDGDTDAAKQKAAKEAEERDSAVNRYLTNKPQGDTSAKASLTEKFSDRSIRAFGLAVGAGTVGAAVSAGVVLTDNVTEAVLGGNVKAKRDVTVSAEHDYGSVMAATGAVAGGMYGASASVSVAQANGTVKAIVEEDTKIRSQYGAVSVTTHSDVDADALAVTAGGGLASVNAGVALPINRLNQETGIRAYAGVTTSGNVNVGATSNTRADAWLLGVSVGGAALNLNAAVSDVAANVNTYVGESLPRIGGKYSASDTMPAAHVSAKQLSVSNTVTSSATPKAASVAAGGAALGGNALLAFNDTEANAVVQNPR